MFIGVDIGGTKCAVTLGDANGNIIDKVKFATMGVKETVDNILIEAKKLKTAETLAVGVSCGGPLDEEKGIILSPPNLPGWDEIHIKELLEDATALPCGVRNDANGCAMAEFYFGAGRNTKNMVFMTFGTGLGAGLILNGRLFAGTNGFAGELGHIRLDAFGPAGYGKCGSFEGFCSGSGIEELARQKIRESVQQGKKVLWATEGFNAKDVAEAARKGDTLAREIFDICGAKLGQGLAVVIDLLNPEKIIIGSVFARCRDLLEPKMYEVLKHEALSQALGVCEITVPELGEKIGDAAALAIAKEAYDEIHG